MAIKQAKILTVTSAKGGTGKTTTLLNLAGAFQKLGKKVLIIDLDLYGSAIATHLCLPNEKDLYKVVEDMVNNRFDYIENYVEKYNEFMDVLPAPKDPRYASKISAKNLSVLLSRVAMRYEIVLVDTNYFMGELNLTVMDYSDFIFYVLSNSSIDIKNMKNIVTIYKDIDKKNYRIILNEAKDKNHYEFSHYDIKNIIKSPIDYVIPSGLYLKHFDKIVMDGKIMTLDPGMQKSHAKELKVYEQIAKDVLKETER